MNPYLTRMTAAAIVAPAMVAEAWARAAATSLHATAGLFRPAPARTDDAARETAEAATDAVTEERREVLDRAGAAMEAMSKTLERGAAELADGARQEAPDEPRDGSTDDAPRDAAAETVAAPDHPAAPPAIDGTLTAAGAIVRDADAASDLDHSVADIVAEATGSEPKALDEMLPHGHRPPE